MSADSPLPEHPCGGFKFRRWSKLLSLALLGALGVSAIHATPLQAAEPASEFLNGLREKGYYDMAVAYLDRMATSDLVTVEFKQVLNYEKGVTLAEASKRERDFAARASMLDEANAALEKFIKENPKSKLAAGAQNQLGNLLVERARMIIEKSEKPSGAAQKPQLMKEAQGLFDQAHTVFANSQEVIKGQLQDIKPNLDSKIPKEAAQIELRDELRKQYLQAELLSAAALEAKADTSIGDKATYSKILTEAAEEYKAIHEKYRTWIAGLYARLYQGRCYQRIAEHPDATKEEKNKNYQEAISYYTDLLEEPDDPPPFRTLKTKALLLAVDCWLATDKADAAVNKGLEWVAKIRPNEEQDLEWLELRLKLAKALKIHSDKQTDAKQKKQFIDDARKLATVVSKSNTDYKKEAQKLMLTLGGVDAAADGERPPAKNFTEAKDLGREALGRMQASDFALKNLPAQIKAEKDSGIKAELEKQLKDAQDGLASNRQEAIDYFNQALSLADAETTTDDLNVVRYFLCYLNYIDQKFYRSAVLGEFLARRYPNSAGAKPSAKIAMAAYLKLYKEEAKEDRDFETQKAVGIAQYITDRWPDAPEATEALNTLIPFMIQAGDLDKAMAYVDKVPADSPVRGEAELKTGQAMWSRYLTEMFQLRKEQQGETPPTDVAAREAELEELKTKAQQVLADGIERMRKAGKVDSTIATAVLSLAQIYVDLGQPDKAIPLLEDKNIGALNLVISKNPATERAGFAAETFKTALRAYIGSLATSGDSDITIKKAQGVMQLLNSAMGSDEKGQERLVAIYVSLAKDLEQQLEISDEKSKQPLSSGFETFLTEVQKSADRFDVLNWVAETFYSLGKGFDNGVGNVNAQSRGYYEKAISTYEKLLARQKSDPTYMPKPELALQVQMRMATTLRRMGQYGKAVDMFAAILKQKKSMLNVQVEAALTLQEWGAATKDNTKYLKAMQGDVKGADGKDVIWGWGQLSQVTSRFPGKFKDTFHDSRFNLALASYNMAGNAASNQEKMTHLGRAKKYISATYRIYPDLGGAERTKQYDLLMKKVQQGLGEPTAGLKAFDQATASAGA